MTIYALSSGSGISGIASIRISGELTKNVVENQLKQRNIKYYTLSDAKTLLTQLKNQTPEKSKLLNLELNQL